MIGFSKKTLIISILLILAGSFFLLGDKDEPQSSENDIINTINEGVISTTMNITSTAFDHNEAIPQRYTCDGENVSPPLEFSEIPEGTKALVLIVDDPDAPRGTWVHWLVWDLLPDGGGIKEGSLPDGAIEGETSFEEQKYGGPCPPSGEHRYFFKLYALDADIDIPPKSNKETLEEEMAGHVIDRAELVGLYKR